jgi:hypothetical protein
MIVHSLLKTSELAHKLNHTVLLATLKVNITIAFHLGNQSFRGYTDNFKTCS